MNSEKLINSFDMQKSIDHLIIYGKIIFWITFRHCYYAKYVFDIFNKIDFS